ncbi:MAG: HPr family phosphocarrier protein [Candidatus Riflebacteria bacterium]|nr:HPr family phosphocarrier protein [Candidatus Riflebacteria bacterium]
MVSRRALVSNRLGFHLRAVSTIVEACSKFKAGITLARDGDRRNGRSILDLMMLEADMGTVLTIEADGVDETEAVDTLVKLFECRFGEE